MVPDLPGMTPKMLREQSVTLCPSNGANNTQVAVETWVDVQMIGALESHQPPQWGLGPRAYEGNLNVIVRVTAYTHSAF